MKPFGPSFLLILLVCTLNSFSQQTRIKFDHLTTIDGLSQSNVLCIIQDSRGFMWFGTRDGLNKYDGYKFTVYKPDPKDKNSISGNFISSIIESRTGDLWIATKGGGISRFERSRNRFINYKYDPQNVNGISSNDVNSVAEDKDGNIWIGTESSGLDILDVKTNKFSHFTHDPGNPKSISDNFIRTVYKDSRNNIWIGTMHGGLNLYNYGNRNFTSYQHDEKNKVSLSYDDVYCIYEDSRKRFWIGTNGGGINLMNTETGNFSCYKSETGNSNSLQKNEVYAINEDGDHKLWMGTENGGLSVLDVSRGVFTNYLHDEVDNNSIGNNSIYSICRDSKGNMWIGSFTAGVDFFNHDNQFAHYKHSSLPSSLSDNRVLCIYEDSKKNIWVATDGGGLNLFNPYTSVFTHFLHDDHNKNSICGNYVLSVTEDNQHNLWLGTWGDGVSVYNPDTKTFTHFKHNIADQGSISSNNAWVIYEDRDKNIWIGTYGGGLNLYDAVTHSFIHFNYDKNDPQSINSYNIESLYDDGKGNLWIGTDGGGLNIMDKKTHIVTRYLHDDKKNSIASNSVETIYEDQQGIFWIATQAGLSRFDRKTGLFKTYTTEQGLPNNVIFGIIGDDKNDLWISTDRGICRFSPATNTFRNFTVVDGLQGNEFKEKAFCKSSTGAFYFGGNNGFNVFYPYSIRKQFFEPPLLLTGFRVLNKDLPIATDDKDPSPLKQDISETHSLTLPYSSSVIQFEFAALNYTSREKKQYSYMLEGFDKTWTQLNTKRTATYTNLDPGTYTFKVKALNNSGELSSKILTFELIITPPFWLTWWFKLIAVLTVAGICVAFYRIRMNAVKVQKKILEKQVEERTQQLQQSTREERKAREEAEKAKKEAEEASKAKSIFLATMSHEIRTPMNGVIGMASLLGQTPLTEKQKEYTDVIRVCGETLLNVINDILDFSKIESGNMSLENNDFDLRACIEEVLDVFAEKAAKKGIDLVYQIDYNVPSYILGDSLRLKQVLMNLVSNAIKFTQTGEIFVGVNVVSSKQADIILNFEVRDTGIGIPNDKLDRLFRAFSQVDSTTTRKYGGTGLGLVICEKLVGLMHGKIQVQSVEGKGSSFSFTVETKTSSQAIKTYFNNNMASLDGRRILIVDDNHTNRTILQTQLEQWKLLPVVACNGFEAMSILAHDATFDLVLTDMEMPGMDGVELTQQLHTMYPSLPVILLSSLCDNTFKAHAHLFASVITKPIKQQMLSVQIVNALRKQGRNITVANTMVMPVKETNSDTLAAKYPLRILLAEDDVFNQMVALQVLENIGYSATIAENGRIAVEYTQGGNYDLVLMDVQMPEMDGLEATKCIRETLRRQPVILAMTANAMDGDRNMCMLAGMDDYISKPVNIEELMVKLKKWALHIHRQ